MICPLCFSKKINHYFSDSKREYQKCVNCDLVFVDTLSHLSLSEEKKRYDLHDNTSTNRGYVKYLDSMYQEICKLNITNPEVLDFGCGKNAVLESILKNSGVNCISYDPLYKIGMDSLNKLYDIVVFCEVIEHVSNLHEELLKISSLTKNSGYLILRTELLTNKIDFKSWWYKEDLTHINFLSPKTIDYVAEIIEGRILTSQGPITVIKKNTPSIS